MSVNRIGQMERRNAERGGHRQQTVLAAPASRGERAAPGEARQASGRLSNDGEKKQQNTGDGPQPH